MADPLVGQMVGPYRVESVLGRGGMGVVYRAVDERLGRTVALKLVATDLTADDTFVRRFLAEGRAAAAVEHPNVVSVYDVGAHQGRPWLAMRMVDGQNLAELLAAGPLEPRRALRLVRGVRVRPLAGAGAGPDRRRGHPRHADGIIHVHPTTGTATGPNANFSRFLEAIGATVDGTSFTWPTASGSSETHVDGETCGGKPAKVTSFSDGIRYPDEATTIRLFDRETLVLAFVPEETTYESIGDPPSTGGLDHLIDDAPPGSTP